jgi:hypothetical protein
MRNVQVSDMPSAARRSIYGALSGAIGAACMTVIRMAARRRGLIDKTVSQTAEEWLAVRMKVRGPHDPSLHHLFEQLLHTGYGASLGVLYGWVRGRRQPASRSGALFGVATWLGGSWLLMPILRAKRPPWRKGLAENAIDLLAHLTYGLAVDLVAGEMTTQQNHRPSSDLHRWLARVG